MARFILDIYERRGVTIVLIEHDMGMVMDISDRVVVLDFGPAMKTPDYLSINPMGKVPAIRHKGQVVSECAAICAYLADAFPQSHLAPPPERRGDYYRWLFFAAGPLEAAVTNQVLGLKPPAERESMVGYGNFATVMDTLERAVAAKPYVAGDDFTAADVYVGAQIGWGLQFGSIERRPAFESYWQKLASRSACQRASTLDDAAMRAKTD